MEHWVLLASSVHVEPVGALGTSVFVLLVELSVVLVLLALELLLSN